MSSNTANEDNLKSKIAVMQKAERGYSVYQRKKGDNSWSRIHFLYANEIKWNFDAFEYKADQNHFCKYNYEKNLVGKQIWSKDDSLTTLLIVAQDTKGVYIGTLPFVIEYSELEEKFNVQGEDY
jgi:hypothetical protein